MDKSIEYLIEILNNVDGEYFSIVKDEYWADDIIRSVNRIISEKEEYKQDSFDLIDLQTDYNELEEEKNELEDTIAELENEIEQLKSDM